jgi:hypothetical protein
VAQDITREELKEKIDNRDNFVLVDVLDEQYYRRADEQVGWSNRVTQPT